MKIKLWILFISLLFSLTLFFYFGAAKSSPVQNINFNSEIEKIHQKFETSRIDDAVNYFIDKYETIYDDKAIHVLEHYLGKELYSRAGLNGLKYCPDSLHAGCYHGFFIDALSAEGLAFIPIAEKVCNERPIFLKRSLCIHGIGHGLLAANEKETISSILPFCDKSNDYSDFDRQMCYSGIFMEYNDPTSHGLEIKVNLRDLEDTNIYSLCPGVADKYKPMCYFELPLWWLINLEKEDEPYKKIYNYCREISPDLYRDFCFRRIGAMRIAEPGMTTDKAAKKCHEIGIDSAAISCLEGVAESKAMEEKPNPLNMCEVFTSSETQNLCRNKLAAAYSHTASFIK